MGLLGPFSSMFVGPILLPALFWQVACSPIPRAIDAFASVDPSPDAWAETLSGIGPLILLVGERVTKQLLRNIRGAPDAFHLAAAPLGLLSVVTSLIRCCGIQRLRAFIGYELEARAIAAIDMTRVNCGGVHAEIVDGYINRSTAANPASEALAVSLLQGSVKEMGKEALLQIRLCDAFEKEKSIKGVPDVAAALQWVLHVLSSKNTDTFQVIRILVQAVDSGFLCSTGDDTIRVFCQSLTRSSKYSDQANYGEKLNQEEISPVLTNSSDPKGPTSLIEISEGPSSRGGEDIEQPYGMSVTVREATSETLNSIVHVGTDMETLVASGTSSSRPKDISADMPALNFMYTLNAVSEFTTTSPVPVYVAMLFGLTSFLAILTIYTLALWHDQWEFSAGWILVFIGYIGIVVTVMSAALLIHSSCACIKLENRSALNPTLWTDGLVVAVKNTDSMDTRGSSFMSSQCKAQRFELVWMRDLTWRRQMLASGTAIALVLFFICHYLGLRSTSWWVAIAELAICLLAAVARSATKDRQEKFNLVEQVKIDKRCTSTGIIQTQKCQMIEKRQINPDIMDARAYSAIYPTYHPVTGESIAWHIAKSCFQDKHLATKILDLTEMRVHVMKDSQQIDTCAIIVSYNGGLLVKEGLAAPNARLCLAFRTRISDLALPTALLARAIMRQPEWYLEDEKISNGIPLGDVYIFSINSIIDWWSISEDRNDFGDLQKNLQWPFFLINTAFFISLLRFREQEGLELNGIEEAHGNLSESNEAVVENVMQFLRNDASRR